MSTTMSELLNRKATEFYTRPGNGKKKRQKMKRSNLESWRAS